MEPASSHRNTEEGGQDRKALVISSSEGFQKRLSEVLKRGGWDCGQAYTPEEALERVEDGTWSLVLLDTLLPRTNGFDLCRRIKSLPAGSSLPVYLFGGNVVGKKEDIVTLWGCEDFLPKTIEDDDILLVLQKISADTSEVSGTNPESSEQPTVAPDMHSPTEGNLIEKSILELFYDFYTERRSGTLTLRNGDVEKAVYFDGGRPTFAITNQMEDKLGEVLVRSGRLAGVELKDALDISEREGKRLGGVLVDMGIVKAEELRSLVQRHMEEIVYSLFEWEDGEYMVTPMDISRGEDILLEKSAGNVIMDGVRRRYTLDRIKKILGPSTRVFRLSASPAISIRDLRLSPSEAKIVDLIDGRKNMEDIMSSTALTPLDVSRVLFCLVSLKIIEEANEGPLPAKRQAFPALPMDSAFVLDPVALLDVERNVLPSPVVGLLKLFDGRRTLLQVIDESMYEKEATMSGIRELLDRKLLKTADIHRRPSSEQSPVTPTREDIPPIEDQKPVQEEDVHPTFHVEEPHDIPDLTLVETRTAGGHAFRKIMAIALPPLFVTLMIMGVMLYMSGPERRGNQRVEPQSTPPAQPSMSGEPPPSAGGVQRPPAEISVPETALVPREAVPEPGPPSRVEQSLAEEQPKAAPKEPRIVRLRRAAEATPDSPDVLLKLGTALVNRGKAVEGILYIKKAISIAPGSARAHVALGKAYKALGDKDKALAEFKEALRLEPSGPYSDQSMALIIELKK